MQLANRLLCASAFVALVAPAPCIAQTVSPISGSGSGSITNIATGACLTGGPITTTGTVSGTYAINAQTGTSYTVLSTDACKLVTFSNGSAIAVTLPQATGSFGAGFGFDVQNLGVGTVTITPTTSTVNGAATLVLTTNQGCTLISDGTNWQVSACPALITGGLSSPITTAVIDSTPGASATPAWKWTGALYKAGNGTTNVPLNYWFDSGATAVTSWDANGTVYGMDAHTSCGKWYDIYIDNVEKAYVACDGGFYFANGGQAQNMQLSNYFGIVGKTIWESNADGTWIALTNSATLPTLSSIGTAATAGAGARATIGDATACATFAGTVTGGGSTKCPLYSDGTVWRQG